MQTAYMAAVRVIVNFWTAVIAARIQAKSKHRAATARLKAAGILSGQADIQTAVIEQLMADLRRIDRLYGKPYHEWSDAERKHVAGVIEEVYAERTKRFLRPRGRPKKRFEARGLVFGCQIEAELKVWRLLKDRIRDLKLTLPHLVDSARLEAWAAKEGFTSPEAARRHIEDHGFDPAEIERAIPAAEVIGRHVPEAQSDRKLAKRLEVMVSRAKRGPR